MFRSIRAVKSLKPQGLRNLWYIYFLLRGLWYNDTPMTSRLLRVYQNLDLHEVKEHLLVYGALNGQCAHCQTMEIRLDAQTCPSCGTAFRYLAFRNVKDHMPKILNLQQTRPQLILVDYEDYKHHAGALKAEEFLR